MDDFRFYFGRLFAVGVLLLLAACVGDGLWRLAQR